jgi:hypothetical protein
MSSSLLAKDAAAGVDPAPAFYSVAATARMFGMSEMTLYRAIHSGQFPAVRIGCGSFEVTRVAAVTVDTL